MAVDTQHPQFVRMLPTWRLNYDASNGSVAVKRRTVTYLPVPNPDETTAESERYLSYLKRAVFVNYTGRTIRGLTGAVFRQAPTTELPPQIDYLADDADNNRLSLATIAQRAVSEVLRAGRYVVLAEFPESKEGATAEQTAGLRAYLACFRAEAFVNWHETNGQLDLAVLYEVVEEPHSDGFDFDYVDYYRVLRLHDPANMDDETRVFFGSPKGKFATLQIYREKEAFGPERVITGFDGQPFDEIPLIVMGSEDNDLSVDMPPISDIAGLNIAHYRNSADYEEGVFTHGQPMLVINPGDTNATEFTEVNGKVMVGSRAGLVVQNGSAELLQAQANSAAMEAMTHKETQIVRLGGQIIADAKGNETAEAARIRSGAETSVLNSVVNNVSDGFSHALRWCCRYMGGNEDAVEFKLNRQFFPHDVDPQVMAQIIMGIDRGLVPSYVYQDYLRKGGMVPAEVTNEKLTSDAGQASPLVG